MIIAKMICELYSISAKTRKLTTTKCELEQPEVSLDLIHHYVHIH